MSSRVLRVALLVAAPARVAQQVDHRRPEVEAPDGGILRVQAARLVADRVADLLDQRRCPTCWPGRAACGKTVAVAVTTAPLLFASLDQATPCSASVPALNSLMPSRGMAGSYWCSSDDLLVQGEPPD